MKRPPKPTDYKHGDFHPGKGKVFKGYVWYINRWCPIFYTSSNVFDAHIEIMYKAALQRARKENLPFDIDIEYLKSIRTSLCPVFGMTLSWGRWDNKGERYNAPSLDKIKPEYGYIKGNVCIISNLANSIKQNVGYEELYKVADWLHEKEKEVEKNVRPEQLACLPTKSRKSSKNNPQPGSVFTTGARENGDDVNDYRGAVQGENSYHSAKEGGGDSMGHGDAEVETPIYPEGFEDPWDTSSTVGSVNEWFERVRSKSRELDLATGTANKIRQFGD